MPSSPYCAGSTICFGFVFWKLHQMHQLVKSYMRWTKDVFSPAIMDINFTVDEIEETGIKLTAQPGRDDISVCTSIAFCLREAERNAYPCSGAQQFCSSSCFEYEEPQL